nr:acetyltransferase [Vibrio sp. Isolate25]
MIVGCGSHAHAVISAIESSTESYEILGLVDIEDNYDPAEEKSDYKVLHCLKDLLTFPKKYNHLLCVIAVGDNSSRKRVYDLLKIHGFSFPNIVSKSAFVDRTAILGEGNIVSHNAVINAQSKLGNNNLVNTGSIIEHDCILGDHNHLGPRVVICGRVIISDLAFLGAGSTVLPNLSIADGIVLGAGSLLNFSALDSGSRIVGVPAKVKNK